MDNGTIIVVVTGGVAAYGIVRYRLLKAAASTHMELAERGERLLAQANLNFSHRKSVEFMLDSAYSRWLLPFAIVAMPFMVGHLILSRSFRIEMERLWRGSSPEVKSELESIDRLFTLCICAVNPLWGLIFLTERAILFVFVAVVAGQIVLIDLALDIVLQTYGKYGGTRRAMAHVRHNG